MILQKQIPSIERSEITTLKSFNSTISLSDALVLFRMSWKKVTPETILKFLWESIRYIISYLIVFLIFSLRFTLKRKNHQNQFSQDRLY